MKLILFVLIHTLAVPLSISCNTHTPPKPYITAQVIGGLGNMLFQVATACAVGWDNDAEVYFPELSSKPTYLYHVFSKLKVSPPSKVISVLRSQEYPIRFEPNMKLQGYFQEERFFAHHRDKLTELFAPRPVDLQYIKRNYTWLLEHPKTVGVQLRYYRKEVIDGYPQYGAQFLEKAMRMFPEDTLFVISSDNLEFARTNIPIWAKNIYFIENEADYINLFLLSLCKDNIISNSSFGWWAAWLNKNPNNTVICPSTWTGYSTDEIYPKDWIRIDAEPEKFEYGIK